MAPLLDCPLVSGSGNIDHCESLRADVCKYQPAEVCKSEKFKILKKIHNIAHGKLLQEIHVLLRSDNYF